MASRMNARETSIEGCFEISLDAHPDERGSLVKTLSSSALHGLNLETGFVESVYSVSNANVLRGMHLQLSPADNVKLLTCLCGSVMDIALDLRLDSTTFGQFAVIELSDHTHNAAYLPKGVAHGFYVRQAPAILYYHLSSEYQPGYDAGVAWNSFGAPWPAQDPIVSARDAALPSLAEFRSRLNSQPSSSTL